MWHVLGTAEMCTGFWWGKLRERDHWGEPDVDARPILLWLLQKERGRARMGLIWLRIQTVGTVVSI